jgi:alanine dehydrogenase
MALSNVPGADATDTGVDSMIVGVPREIKSDEYRVGMIPAGVEELRSYGHEVIIEKSAGLGSGITDEDFLSHGATIVNCADEIYSQADMIVKVKEPQPEEIRRIRPGQTVFAYFHFAASRELTEAMIQSGAVAVAFETIADQAGHLPLLKPMSEVAGKMSIQEGAKYLERPMRGRGILLGGVPGVEPATVLILGGGIVGSNAAKVAAGMGARIVLMDVKLDQLRYLSDVMPANVQTTYSDRSMIRRYIREADLVIGAVLIPGARCPQLVTREHLSSMKPGAVIVDVGVDQGGCCETIRPTTHSDPVYELEGVVHYGVTNMPGAVGRTSTFALANATLPYAVRLANLGYKKAAQADPGLAAGINIQEGRVTYAAVARTFGMKYQPAALD